MAARLAAEDDMYYEDVSDLEAEKTSRKNHEKNLRRLDHVADWNRTRAKKKSAAAVSSTQELSGGSPLTTPEVPELAAASSSPTRIGVDDPSLDLRPEELPFIERLNIWQARDSGRY